MFKFDQSSQVASGKKN